MATRKETKSSANSKSLATRRHSVPALGMSDVPRLLSLRAADALPK
jgi:hypothetical protein